MIEDDQNIEIIDINISEYLGQKQKEISDIFLEQCMLE